MTHFLWTVHAVQLYGIPPENNLKKKLLCNEFVSIDLVSRPVLWPAPMSPSFLAWQYMVKWCVCLSADGTVTLSVQNKCKFISQNNMLVYPDQMATVAAQQRIWMHHRAVLLLDHWPECRMQHLVVDAPPDNLMQPIQNSRKHNSHDLPMNLSNCPITIPLLVLPSLLFNAASVM